MLGSRTELGRQIRAGTATALVGGAAVGGLLGLAFLSTPHAFLVVSGWLPRVATVGLLSTGLGLAAAAALLPVEILVAFVTRLWAPLAQVRPLRLYAALLGAGLLFVHGFFSIAFNVVRDLHTARGLQLVAGLAATLGIAFLAVVLSSRRDDRREPARPGATTLALALVWFLVAGSVCGHALQTHVGRRASLAWAVGPRADAAARVGLAPAQRWNVILISIDTLRADHLSTYGYERPTTPRLDSLAAEGASFRNAYSQAPWTLPSHASMLTGLYSSRHGARFYSTFRFSNGAYASQLDERNTTLAELLHSAGYRSAAFASTKWLGRQFGMTQGFETFESTMDGRDATAIVDEATAWVESSEDAAFFLFLHFFDVHNYTSPPPYAARYERPYSGKLAGKLSIQSYRGGNLFDALTRDDLAYMIAKYDGALSYVDAEIGRMLDNLRKLGLADRTLIVVTSDHGEEFWDHGGTAHGFTLYDEQLRVPLIVKPPAALPAVTSTPSVHAGLIDIVPTVLDYLGMPPPSPVDGISLRPFIEDPQAAPPTRRLFAEDTFFFNTYAVLDGDFKYIIHTVPPAGLLDARLWLANLRSFYKYRGDEMFRLSVDPREMHDVADDEPALVDRLDDEITMHLRAAVPSHQARLESRTVEELESIGYANP